MGVVGGLGADAALADAVADADADSYDDDADNADAAADVDADAHDDAHADANAGADAVDAFEWSVFTPMSANRMPQSSGIILFSSTFSMLTWSGNLDQKALKKHPPTGDF